MAQCTAKSKRSGERCKNNCSPGRTTCRYHGGSIPRGFDLPQTKHGLYSKSMPRRLLADYNEFYANPKSIELRESIAVTDARLADLLKELYTVEVEGCWEKFCVQYHRMENAFANHDQVELNSAMIEMEYLLNAGVRESRIWKEFMATLEQRRKLSDAQLKWEIRSGQWISEEQATTLFTAVGHIMRE